MSHNEAAITIDNGSTALSRATAEDRAAAIAKGLRAAARKARAPTVFVSGGGGFAARKGARMFFYGIIASFVLLFLVPTIAVSIYYGLIASDQYASETRFALKTGETSVLDSIAGIAGISGSQSSQDSKIIAAYIKSRAMVEDIDAAFDFRKLYAREDVDYFSRFKASDRIEDMVKYWNKRIDAKVESESGIITVEVRAFSPEEALAIANKIVELSEALINRMSERARQATLKQSTEELYRAQAKMREASNAMRNIRNSEGIIDATLVAETANKITNVLKIELSSREEEYAVRSTSISPDAPQMRILAAQIANLKEQIDTIKGQLTNAGAAKTTSSRAVGAGKDGASKDGAGAAQGASESGAGKPEAKTLAASMSIMERFQLDLSLAQQQYASAATAYESARLDVETQHAYLTPFLAPTLAQKAIYPKRWWNWSIIVFPALVLWLILLGVSFLVRDHMV
ncbi:MAG: hypothetical protein K2P80_05540 [Beijerinckiaceae bacterium]|nr:hypothetical protein [Beijerinckiaceae bacterium]